MPYQLLYLWYLKINGGSLKSYITVLNENLSPKGLQIKPSTNRLEVALSKKAGKFNSLLRRLSRKKKEQQLKKKFLIDVMKNEIVNTKMEIKNLNDKIDELEGQVTRQNENIEEFR